MTQYDHLYIYEIEGTVDDTSLTSPDYIGCWNEGNSSFLFFRSENQALVDELVSRHPDLRFVDAYDMDYEDWQGGRLIPFRVGSLWFCPPFGHQPPPPDGCRPVPFDPGVVFGTGLHPTTLDCLQLITELFREETPKTVLDLGTGTGILSLAAAFLGAERVVAVDINRLSVETARHNVGLNRLEDRITVVEADARDAISGEADLAIMNIHFSVLNELTETDAFYDKKGVILSGVLRSDYYTLLKKLQKRIRLVRERQTGHWFTAWFGT